MARQKKLPPGMWQRGDVYYARFRANGQQVRQRLSTNFEAAKTLLNELRARADRGDFGLRDNDYPWENLHKEFMQWARQSLRPSTVDGYETDLAKIQEYCGTRSIRQINPKYVFGYREWRLSQDIARPNLKKERPTDRKVCARTVNREVGTLANMLNKGVEWGRIGSNPISGIKPLPHDELVKDRRPLTLAEVESLFRESSAYLLPVWRMFMVSGIREGELVNLQFDDVDFGRRTATVRSGVAKNHKAREIPIEDEALAMIIELQKAAEDRHPVPGLTAEMTDRQRKNFSRTHVFVTKANTPLRNNLLTRFYATCKRAGIEDARPGGSVDIHSLRVTFTTMAIDNGANPKDVQAMLGHATLGMTMGVYAKATEQGKRAAVGSLPFASASAPDHIISMDERRRATA